MQEYLKDFIRQRFDCREFLKKVERMFVVYLPQMR